MNCLLLQRILAIVGLGVVIGAADSWIRPTTITLRLPEPKTTAASPADPLKQSLAKAATSDSGTPEAAPTPAPISSPDSPSRAAESDLEKLSGAGLAGAQPPAQPLGLMIDAVAAKSLFDDGVVFLDARITEEFKAGHVPQAFQLNSAMFNTPAAEEAMKALDKLQPIVIYCGGGDCDASKNLAILLQGAGYERIHIFEAGFPAWEKAGYPVERERK